LRVHHDGRDLSLTMSIGIAEYPAPAKSADDLLKLADVALYQAKREGRNRIVLAR
jgi:diguanylate cyclase (GGDEF)-like protein